MSIALAIVVAQLAAQSSSASPSLKAARIYFEEFEYSKCVERADQASREELDDRELAAVELLIGLCKFHLGIEAEAATHFRVALRLDRAILLPPYTSPRIVALFEAEAAKRPAPPPPIAQAPAAERKPETPLATERKTGPSPTEQTAPTDAPISAPAEKQLANAVPTPTPAFVPTTAEAKVEPARSLLWPAAFGGLAVLTAGGGAWFGLEAKRLEGAANGASFESDFHLQARRAEQSALVANALFGAATLAASGAVLSYVLSGD